MTENAPKKRLPKNRSGWIMLTLVTIIYLVIFYLDPSKGEKALFAAADTLKIIGPVLILVLFLIALMNTWIDPKSIAKHMGSESGVKGWIIALAGGVFTHGSSLVWYPLLADLRGHSVRDGLIVAFFYARAIKIPWLPVMVSYFGLSFTIILSLYIILGAWLQGIIADKILAKDEG